MKHKDPCVHCVEYGGKAPIYDSFCSQYIEFYNGAQWIGVCKNHLIADIAFRMKNQDEEERAKSFQLLRQLALAGLN